MNDNHMQPSSNFTDHLSRARAFEIDHLQSRKLLEFDIVRDQQLFELFASTAPSLGCNFNQKRIVGGPDIEVGDDVRMFGQ